MVLAKAGPVGLPNESTLKICTVTPLIPASVPLRIPSLATPPPPAPLSFHTRLPKRTVFAGAFTKPKSTVKLTLLSTKPPRPLALSSPVGSPPTVNVTAKLRTPVVAGSVSLVPLSFESTVLPSAMPLNVPLLVPLLTLPTKGCPAPKLLAGITTT